MGTPKSRSRCTMPAQVTTPECCTPCLQCATTVTNNTYYVYFKQSFRFLRPPEQKIMFTSYTPLCLIRNVYFVYATILTCAILTLVFNKILHSSVFLQSKMFLDFKYQPLIWKQNSSNFTEILMNKSDCRMFKSEM